MRGFKTNFSSNSKVYVRFIHKTRYYGHVLIKPMARKYIQRRKKEAKGTKSQKTSKTREFYLMEKLYEAMRNDKKRGNKPSSSAREFYLMEKLYQAMVNDKNRSKKSTVS